MQIIEWVVEDSVYWANVGVSSPRPAILMAINPEIVVNTRIAYVLQPKLGIYEAILVRANHGTWTLGEFTDLQEAKDAIISALVLDKLEH